MVFGRRGCSNCHGPTGSEGPSIQLVGGDVTTRTNYWPILHWPFAPSIWDYIRRVMPYDRPGVLTDDEAYAVTAYLLYRNGIIGENDVMDAQSLREVRDAAARRLRHAGRVDAGDAARVREPGAPLVSASSRPESSLGWLGDWRPIRADPEVHDASVKAQHLATSEVSAATDPETSV